MNQTPTQSGPRFRMLPALIVVAMLAFSVRLVDFATGVSNLSGSAMAQEEMSANNAGSMEDSMPDDSMLSDGSEAAEGDESFSQEEIPAVDWRDPNDDDIAFSEINREVFDDLAKRRKMLDRREKELMTRDALLRAAEQELDRKFQELSTLREEIENLLQQQSEEERARIQSLVKIYEGMKPKEAARIFDTLDLDVLMAVMSRMSERRASPILANMNPERARTVTILLAEEKQLPTLPGSN